MVEFNKKQRKEEMLSINEIKKRLPQEFMQNIYEMFSPGVVDKILVGMGTQRETTLRVNTLQYDIQELMKYFKEKNIKFERVPWYKDGIVLKNANEKDIQRLDIYERGYLYLQSLSSMVPPVVLNPKPGESVLDLTAAPGSKTTQMAALMENKGYILANELDKIRCERLKYNIENQNAKIVEAINGRGEKIGEQNENKFDKVLLDAPCSGEGRFLMDSPQTYRNWNVREVTKLASLQKKLFQSAYKALKPQGTMVYSTCTLNKQENEEVLEWAIKEMKLKILDIGIEIREAIPAFVEGKDVSISKAIRILPSKGMEGFFVCKLKKEG